MLQIQLQLLVLVLKTVVEVMVVEVMVVEGGIALEEEGRVHLHTSHHNSSCDTILCLQHPIH